MMAVVIVFGLMCTLIGRWVFGRWFNHISLYSAVWGMSLAFFELRLINYYPLATETWLLIFGAWIAFVLGSLTVVAARASGRPALSGRAQEIAGDRNAGGRERDIPRLLTVLWALNLTALAVGLYNWAVLLKKFGGIAEVLVLSNIIRTMRVANEIPGTIQYVDSIILTAALLAGIYTARTGKLTFAALVTVLTVVIIDFGSFGRAKILLSGVLFLSGYFLTPGRAVRRKSAASRIRQLAGIVTVLAVLATGAEAIRSYRGIYEEFSGATQTLAKLRGGMFLTPSVYLYMTVHPGVLNQYLLKEQEQGLWGGYTFAAAWRTLAKLGFDTQVSYYTPFYNTPVSANTGTYLRELYSDFGLAGAIAGPYLLGLFASVCYFRARMYRRFLDLALLSYSYVAVCWSIFYEVSVLGYWVIGLLAAVIIGLVMDRPAPDGGGKAATGRFILPEPGHGS